MYCDRSVTVQTSVLGDQQELFSHGDSCMHSKQDCVLPIQLKGQENSYFLKDSVIGES